MRYPCTIIPVTRVQQMVWVGTALLYNIPEFEDGITFYLDVFTHSSNLSQLRGADL